jgi:hypothetical protein
MKAHVWKGRICDSATVKGVRFIKHLNAAALSFMQPAYAGTSRDACHAAGTTD